MYGVEMHQSSSYVPRTRLNVRDSDGTIRLAFDFESRGEVCTQKAIDDYKKPYCDVHLGNIEDGIELVADWIKRENIEVLNIAGNAESTYAGTHDAATLFLTELFKGLGLCEGSHTLSGDSSDKSQELRDKPQE